MITEKEILEVYKAGPEAVVALVKGLLETIETQVQEIKNQAQQITEFTGQVQVLTQRVKEQEARLNKDSHNSSKPPGSDGLQKKPRLSSLRSKSGRKPGGQTGHEGYTLGFSETPAKSEPHVCQACEKCGENLSEQPVISQKKRQVYELPVLTLQVTEHQSCLKVCPQCRHENWGEFPEEVTQATQYGPRFESLLVYLNQYQFLPYEREQELLEVLCGHVPSAGSISNAIQKCSDHLEPFDPEMKEELLKAKILHSDETGMRVEGKLNWLHVSSTESYSWYQVDLKRGEEALERIGILGKYTGTVVHDHWKAYFKYGCRHALCNAHHLRELKYVSEQYQQSWADSMAALLCEIKACCEAQEELTESQIKEFESRYESILSEGFKLNPYQSKPEGQRGRAKQTPARNLLERLSQNRQEVLRFMYDSQVPFDNNQAERDLRMMKVKQKISGCFRSRKGAEAFARIRSFISTLKKQGRFLLDELEQVFKGNYQFPFAAPE